MNKLQISKFPKSIAIIIIIVLSLIILVGLNQDTFWAFINFVRDRDAIVAFLDQLGFIGPLALSALLALQVLIPTLPSEPLMIAGAYAYGFLAGFLISWLVAVAASQAVFYLARYAGRPVVDRFVPTKLLDKWTGIASEKGTIFFLLAFVIPPIPSDIMTYVAGFSAISGRRFLMANLIGRMPMVALFTLVGANGFTITPTLILGLTVIGLLMLIAWYYFIMREKPETQATGRSRLALGRSAISKKLSPIAPRLLPIPVSNLARLDQRRIRLAPEPSRLQSELSTNK
jgi:uncharacterized membrane protein YdjX (TVP38/TMEM64 family)